MLEQLPAYKLRPAADELPGRWMTGTQSHEGIVGTLAAVDYLAALGRAQSSPELDRRRALVAAYECIGTYERRLVEVLDRSGVLLSGINWLQWIYVDRRNFPDRGQVLRRVESIIRRVPYVWEERG